jgi:small-conductance mechanosensitive channel
MSNALSVLSYNPFDPRTLLGAAVLGISFFLGAAVFGMLVRRAARRVEAHLSDITGLAFASSLVQVLGYVAAFVLYAHLVPDLRALGTAILTGVSVVSVVIGLAAQNTLGNLIAGFSLVLYRPIRVGDRVQVNTPKGLVTATVEFLSLGYTTLRDGDDSHILVPNSVMMGTVVIRLAREPDRSGTDAG